MARSTHEIWRRKLRRIFDEQLSDLIINRHVFRQANHVWKACADKQRTSDLAEWMVQTYIAFAATAIRRIAEPTPRNPRKGERTLSLVILLEDITKQNEVLTRQWYLRMYRSRKIRERSGNDDFSRLAGSDTARIISKRRIGADISTIRRAAQPMKRFTDKAIAHTEEDRRKIGRPIWRHIDQAVTVLGDVYKRYYLLLTAHSFDPFQIEETIDVTAELSRLWPTSNDAG